MHSIWFGEFLGTLVLVLLGNGVNAAVTLRKSYAADAGWMFITTGWAMAVLCGVLVAQAFGSPGAHINPAITISSAVSSGDYTQLPVYWSAQLLGAMCGAALMALHYGPHWRHTPDQAAKLGIFCTRGAVPSPMFNFISEVIGTMVLVLVAGAIFSHGVSATGRPPAWDRGLSPASCGASAFRSAGPRATPSTPRVTWARGWLMPSCPFRAKAVQTGVTRPFRLWARWWAVRWLASCCISRIFKKCESLRLSRPAEIRFPSAPRLFQA